MQPSMTGSRGLWAATARWALVLTLSAGAVPACSLLPTPAGRTPSAATAPRTRPLAAQTTFTATIPEPLGPGENVTLSVLDEVTGLLVNAVNYTMARRDDLTYEAVVPLPLNAPVKYRYARGGATTLTEDAALGSAIRYRIYMVEGPAEIHDTVADWSDKAFSRPTGTLQGRVVNADTGTPIPNILVNAGGLQYITDSGGQFELPGLPTTTHNFVAYAMDGSYTPFQQGATIAADQTTSVDIQLRPAQPVNVTFRVTAPAESVPGVPVRLAGNILQLGNTFADLQGGMSTVADRMPILNLTEDGRYELTLNLPAGTYVEYKYTLGDGFWNSEHESDGAFALRTLTIPDHDIEVEDAIASWRAGDGSPIVFEVSVPQVTPPGDIVYLQFSPYGWTEPLPMWPLGNNVWAYKLFGPLNTVGTIGYRYCRNAQCGSADDASTAGDAAPGKQVTSSLLPQDIKDVVATWAWYENPEPTTLVGASITPRADGFVTGIEFQVGYHPSWSYYVPQALANVQALGANQVIFTPTWSYLSASPPTFSARPGDDPLWTDTAIMISQARALGLDVALFPSSAYPAVDPSQADRPVTAFWDAARRDAEWWTAWFDRYAAFAVHFADLASQAGAGTLILGGENVAPALPGGSLPDGSPSDVPAAVETRWQTVIQKVRQHYDGTLLWALPYSAAGFQTPLPFLQETDGVYLLWDPALSAQGGASKQDYVAEAGRILDNGVSALPEVIQKPLYLAVAYPSASGAAQGCVSTGTVGCLHWTQLNQPLPSTPQPAIDLQMQADLYEAVLHAVNARPWISGIISRGYYPPASLQDASASVHGKPAADILWYWLPRLSGIVQ